MLHDFAPGWRRPRGIIASIPASAAPATHGDALDYSTSNPIPNCQASWFLATLTNPALPAVAPLNPSVKVTMPIDNTNAQTGCETNHPKVTVTAGR